ncbi:DUF488 family protein [Rhodococcus zopfii]|uniref:DUF488 family protein n=1 Tax=Rhodococcus zopfii TaxID=43772 RepID=UPI0030B87970
MWTIGHWTCPPAVVLDTLTSADIELLVDVRKMPGSRRSPQFDADWMPAWLEGAGIGYRPRWRRCRRIASSSRPPTWSASTRSRTCSTPYRASAILPRAPIRPHTWPKPSAVASNTSTSRASIRPRPAAPTRTG